jgi:hypothetical protein
MNPEHSQHCHCECEQLSNVIRALHSPTNDGRSCRECTRIICLGTPNGLGGMEYPCLTIQALEGISNG